MPEFMLRECIVMIGFPRYARDFRKIAFLRYARDFRTALLLLLLSCLPASAQSKAPATETDSARLARLVDKYWHYPLIALSIRDIWPASRLTCPISQRRKQTLTPHSNAASSPNCALCMWIASRTMIFLPCRSCAGRWRSTSGLPGTTGLTWRSWPTPHHFPWCKRSSSDSSSAARPISIAI